MSDYIPNVKCGDCGSMKVRRAYDDPEVLWCVCDDCGKHLFDDGIVEIES